MADKYILGIDQSTQGTKALLFNEEGELICRLDQAHEQIVNELGWVEHNPKEIYNNTLKAVKAVIEKAGVFKEEIKGVGISNQRETALAWEASTGNPVYNAIVWQCARGAKICEKIHEEGYSAFIKERTGMPLSPYFSGAKLAWILQNVEGAAKKNQEGALCLGTIDSWLVYKLTNGQVFKTDYSNASRTQLFNIFTLSWDKEICELFGIKEENLPRVCDSNALYGYTDFQGFLPEPIPIHGVFGDSHGALYAQGCFSKGMTKTTYGTGSSIMMNIGDTPITSSHGLVTSLAWSLDGKVNYVLEGNVNYTGAVITWLLKDVKLIASPNETQKLALSANQEDKTYLVPAFTGLGAPYWDDKATAIICGMTRSTGQAEIVKAALESIAYQIMDIIKAMHDDTGICIEELRVDGGPTRNAYLMQFQSDITNLRVRVPGAEELSGIGAAYAAGIALGILKKDKVFGDKNNMGLYTPAMDPNKRSLRQQGWREAVKLVLTKEKHI